MRKSLLLITLVGVITALAAPSAAHAEDAADDQFDWLVLSAEAGYRALNIRRVEFDDDTVNPKIIPETSQGFSPALGLGVRLWFVGLMIRADGGSMRTGQQRLLDNDYQLWNLDLELNFRAHVGRVEPYILFGGGFSSLGGLKNVVADTVSGFRARGGNLRAGLGADVFLNKWVSLGGRADVGAVLLNAKGTLAELVEPEQVDTIAQTEARLRDADGSMVAVSYGLFLDCSLHF